MQNNTVNKILTLIEDRYEYLTKDNYVFTLTESSKGYSLIGEEYFLYNDAGVAGTMSGTSKAGFKYGDKAPPASAFSKYTSDKSAQFAIAVSIKQHGIKAKNYTELFMNDSIILDLIADLYEEILIITINKYI